MTELHNEIVIKGNLDDVWNILNTVDALDEYDPTVHKSTATSKMKSGLGASRKVEMKDGKNWFEETCTLSEPKKALKFELTACSFPLQSLSHSYRFEEDGAEVKVKQIMLYQMKYGLLGKLMNFLMVKKQSDKGIKQFLAGLKNHVENLNRKPMS